MATKWTGDCIPVVARQMMASFGVSAVLAGGCSHELFKKEPAIVEPSLAEFRQRQLEGELSTDITPSAVQKALEGQGYETTVLESSDKLRSVIIGEMDSSIPFSSLGRDMTVVCVVFGESGREILVKRWLTLN